MGHRKHSKIDQLAPEVQETVDEMIKTGAQYREIVAYIQENGMSISIAAVGNYAKNLMTTLDALRMSQENFRAIMDTSACDRAAGNGWIGGSSGCDRAAV